MQFNQAHLTHETPYAQDSNLLSVIISCGVTFPAKVIQTYSPLSIKFTLAEGLMEEYALWRLPGFSCRPQHLFLAGSVFMSGDALVEFQRFCLQINTQYHNTATKILFFFIRTFFFVVLFSLRVYWVSSGIIHRLRYGAVLQTGMLHGAAR